MELIKDLGNMFIKRRRLLNYGFKMRIKENINKQFSNLII